MKKLILASFSLLFAITSSAFSFQDQLEARNSQWRCNRTMLVAGEARAFADDRTFVQAHFAAVETVLRNADVSALSAAQLEARNKNIEVLHTYAARGIFPVNHCSYATPVFIDEFNTHCAVGYLMQQSGSDALAMRIASRNNLVHAIDIDDPEIYAWQETSGFTMAELALIQPTYNFHPDPSPPAEPAQYACDTVYFDAAAKNILCGGECTNGQLNGKWELYAAPGRLAISGQFSQGRKNGTWAYYWNTFSIGGNKMQRQETWVNGKRHGPYVEYDTEGLKTSEGSYENDLKSGVWRLWSLGYLAVEENYAAGKLHGNRIIYHIVSASNETRVHVQEVYENEILLSRKSFDYAGVLQDSLRRYYNENMSMLKATISYSSTLGVDSILYSCIRQGQCETETWSYDTKGQLVRHMLTRMNGTLAYQFTYANGKLTSGTRLYGDGRYAETWKADSAGSTTVSYRQFDTAGKEVIKGSCADTDTSARCGTWEFYDSNGTLTAKGVYVNGLKEGVWTETYADGTIWTGAYQGGNKKGTWIGPKTGKRKVQKAKF